MCGSCGMKKTHEKLIGRYYRLIKINHTDYHIRERVAAEVIGEVLVNILRVGIWFRVVIFKLTELLMISAFKYTSHFPLRKLGV